MTRHINSLAPVFEATITYGPIRLGNLRPASRPVPAQLWKGSNFTIRRVTGAEPGTVSFHFSGPFTARDMYSSLTPADLKDLLESGPEREALHIFDLTHVPYTDSAGLGVLVNHLLRCKNNGTHVVLTGVNSRVLQLLKMTGTATLFPISVASEDVPTGCQAN